MNTSIPRGRARLAAAALSTAGLLAAALQLSAAPSAVAGTPGTCATAAHVYLIHGGRAYFAGYDGAGTPIPRLVVSQGELVELGGNGIEPATGLIFSAARFPSPGLEDQPSGFINFGPQPGQRTYSTLGARANCVVHQEGPFRITAPPGKYRVLAQFRAGNLDLGNATTPVVDVEVLPGLPGIGSASTASSHTTTASADLMSTLPSEPDPGDGDTNPDPCGSNPMIECPLQAGAS